MDDAPKSSPLQRPDGQHWTPNATPPYDRDRDAVFLTGSVGSDDRRQRAIELAGDSKGVQDVRANLTMTKG